MPPDSIREMHLAIAQASEQEDWLMAAQHYAKAGDHANAMRVLGSAAGEALGTGAWGAAVEIVELCRDSTASGGEGHPGSGAHQRGAARSARSNVLSSIDRDSLTPEERGLVGLTWAAIHHMNGESETYTD